MHNKFKRKMFKTRKSKDVYIIKKIFKNLNKFVLFLTMRYDFANLINVNTVFLSVNNIVKFKFTSLINDNSNLINNDNKLKTIDDINYS